MARTAGGPPGTTLARLHDSTHVKLPTPAPGHDAAAVERAAEQIAHLLPALADEVRSIAGTTVRLLEDLPGDDVAPARRLLGRPGGGGAGRRPGPHRPRLRPLGFGGHRPGLPGRVDAHRGRVAGHGVAGRARRRGPAGGIPRGTTTARPVRGGRAGDRVPAAQGGRPVPDLRPRLGGAGDPLGWTAPGPPWTPWSRWASRDEPDRRPRAGAGVGRPGDAQVAGPQLDAAHHGAGRPRRPVCRSVARGAGRHAARRRAPGGRVREPRRPGARRRPPAGAVRRRRPQAAAAARAGGPARGRARGAPPGPACRRTSRLRAVREGGPPRPDRGRGPPADPGPPGRDPGAPGAARRRRHRAGHALGGPRTDPAPAAGRARPVRRGAGGAGQADRRGGPGLARAGSPGAARGPRRRRGDGRRVPVAGGGGAVRPPRPLPLAGPPGRRGLAPVRQPGGAGRAPPGPARQAGAPRGGRARRAARPGPGGVRRPGARPREPARPLRAARPAGPLLRRPGRGSARSRCWRATPRIRRCSAGWPPTPPPPGSGSRGSTASARPRRGWSTTSCGASTRTPWSGSDRPVSSCCRNRADLSVRAAQIAPTCQFLRGTDGPRSALDALPQT